MQASADAVQALRLPQDKRDAVSAVIEAQIAEEQSAVSYSAGAPAEETLSCVGYDLEQAYRMTSLNNGTLLQTGSFLASLDECEAYYIPYVNDVSLGAVYVTLQENGTPEITMTTDNSEAVLPAEVDFAAVQKALTGKGEVRSLAVVHDAWGGVNLVIADTEQGETVIPYYFCAYWQEYDKFLKQGEAVSAETAITGLQKAGYLPAEPVQTGEKPLLFGGISSEAESNGTAGVLLSAGVLLLIAAALYLCRAAKSKA